MGEDKKADKKRKRIVPKAPVQMIISCEYVGIQTVTEVFFPEHNVRYVAVNDEKAVRAIEKRLTETDQSRVKALEKEQRKLNKRLAELDAIIINALIDKILVSEREKLTNGTIRKEIKIYYKFIGFVGELHITPTKRWTALNPKNCMVLNMSPALEYQSIVPLVPRGYRGRNQTRANAGAGSKTDRHVLNCPQKITD